jgi:hypothetical protein
MRALVLSSIGFFAAVASSIASPPAYVGAGSFLLPTASSVFDDAADGRLIIASETGSILRQNAVNSSAYTTLGSLPAGSIPSYGAGFVHISPDGSRIAVGDNGAIGRIHVVTFASLTTSGPITPTTIGIPNFDAAWSGPGTLLVNGSPSFGVAPGLRLADAATGSWTDVVSQIGDGSGGVSVHGGRVYTAIGYDAAGLRDGEVRSFALGLFAGSPPVVPFSTGLFAAQANTGNTLDFDAAGNLIEAGFGGVTLVDLATSQRYDLPGLSTTGFYFAIYNDATSEILVRDFGSQTVLRYAVPAPAPISLLGLTGILAARRRRHA